MRNKKEVVKMQETVEQMAKERNEGEGVRRFRV